MSDTGPFLRSLETGVVRGLRRVQPQQPELLFTATARRFDVDRVTVLDVIIDTTYVSIFDPVGFEPLAVGEKFGVGVGVKLGGENLCETAAVVDGVPDQHFVEPEADTKPLQKRVLGFCNTAVFFVVLCDEDAAAGDVLRQDLLGCLRYARE